MTITIEQAKRLAKLGVEVHARFLFRVDERGYTIINGYAGGSVNKMIRYPQMGIQMYEAYNAEELIAMGIKGVEITIHYDGSIGVIQLYEVERIDTYSSTTFYGDTLAEALCNKLIHDIENKRVTVEEINK